MRPPNPDMVKVFKAVDRGMELEAAWVKYGSPTTWGNVLRLYNARTAAAAPAPAAPEKSGSKRKRGAAVATPSKRGSASGSEVAGKAAGGAKAARSGRRIVMELRRLWVYDARHSTFLTDARSRPPASC